MNIAEAHIGNPPEHDGNGYKGPAGKKEQENKIAFVRVFKYSFKYLLEFQKLSPPVWQIPLINPLKIFFSYQGSASREQE